MTWMPNVPLPDGWSEPGGIEACVHCGRGTVRRDASGNPAHVRCLPPRQESCKKDCFEPGHDPGRSAHNRAD